MPQPQNDLLPEVIALLIEAGDLVGKVDPADVSRESTIFGNTSPLGLDSLDALEVVFSVQGRFGVRMDDKHTARQVLQSVGTLCDFIESQRTGS